MLHIINSADIKSRTKPEISSFFGSQRKRRDGGRISKLFIVVRESGIIDKCIEVHFYANWEMLFYSCLMWPYRMFELIRVAEHWAQMTIK